MRRQGPSEGDKGGRKSRVQERDVGEEGLYLCGARGGAESDAALYPIRKAAVSGCMLNITFGKRPTGRIGRLGPAGANDKMMPSEHPREQNASALVDTTHQQMQHQHRHPVLFAMPVPRYHASHERRPGAPFPPKHS